ncbi:MAG: hypothetical protein R3E82_08895 [Pseudomonadales bacterium]|nr:hypothetical protein [Pseudomonadales bacterium]
MITRRRMILSTGLGLAGSTLAPGVLAAASTAAPRLPSEADESDLIYLSPVRTDGSLSRCQAEVWFIREGDDLYVVTAADAWRARAVELGLTRTKVWLGDVGVWADNPGYQQLPQRDMTASLVSDAGVHARVLDVFGGKYRLEWVIWGPRFRRGLADGSRVLLRYQVA